MALEEKLLLLFDSDVLKAASLCKKVGEALGFRGVALGEIGIAVTELASYLLKHKSKNGSITIRQSSQLGYLGIEIVASDEGSSLQHLEAAMKGGLSTADILGMGLSGVKRLMDAFSVSSKPNQGILIVAKKWLPSKFLPKINFSVLNRPAPGEEVSGDAYYIKEKPGSVLFGVIDALGHGRGAYDASKIALEIIEETHTEPILQIINRCHAGLKHSRGVAIALCQVDFLQNKVEHIGIGNVETRIYESSEIRQTFCFNGTLGARIERIAVQHYPYVKGAVFIMHSDGISNKFQLSDALLARPTQDIAEFLFNKFIRSYDDAIVLVGS